MLLPWDSQDSLPLWRRSLGRTPGGSAICSCLPPVPAQPPRQPCCWKRRQTAKPELAPPPVQWPAQNSPGHNLIKSILLWLLLPSSFYMGVSPQEQHWTGPSSSHLLFLPGLQIPKSFRKSILNISSKRYSRINTPCPVLLQSWPKPDQQKRPPSSSGLFQNCLVGKTFSSTKKEKGRKAWSVWTSNWTSIPWSWLLDKGLFLKALNISDDWI